MSIRITNFDLCVFKRGRHIRVAAGRELVRSAEDDGAEGEVVEDIATISPHVRTAVFPETLVVESVYRCYLPRLVVASDKGHPVWISHFQAEKEEEGFEGVEAAVDEVACWEGLGLLVR